MISNFVETLVVYANEQKTVKIANIDDIENKKTLSVKLEASCANNKSDWIKLSDGSPTEINIVYKAPQDLNDDSCAVDLTVNDNDPT